jgi:hypothetical protein
MVLEDLMIEQIADEQYIEIPGWQQKEVLATKKEAEEHPELLENWNDVLKELRIKK